jgi:hypothetical protein
VRFGHPGGRRNLVHAGGFEAAGAEFGDGGFDNSLAFAVGEFEGRVVLYFLHR